MMMIFIIDSFFLMFNLNDDDGFEVLFICNAYQLCVMTAVLMLFEILINATQSLNCIFFIDRSKELY